MLGKTACARDRMGQQREGPTSARTIRVHRLPPFGRDARGRQATRLRALLPAGTNRVTPEETNVREKEIPGRTPLVRALALHGVLRPPGSNRSPAASHLASPLRPGRGVLIRSVSRRLGSVAYVREDASPNEVSRFQPNPACPGAKLNVNSALAGVSLCCSSRCQFSSGQHSPTRRRPGATPRGPPGCRGRAAPGRPGALRAGDPAA
jgi:hypothetical protein